MVFCLFVSDSPLPPFFLLCYSIVSSMVEAALCVPSADSNLILPQEMGQKGVQERCGSRSGLTTLV